jgi:hypothetical protein
MSQQEQKPQWFWCNKHGDFAVRPICPECEHLGQAFTSSVTPAPPEASHRALREIAEAADGGMAYALALMRGRLDVEVPTNADAIRAHITAIEALRAALSTGTETQEPKS